MQRLFLKLGRLYGLRMVNADDYSEMAWRASFLKDALEMARGDILQARAHKKQGQVPAFFIDRAFDRIEKTLKRDRDWR